MEIRLMFASDVSELARIYLASRQATFTWLNQVDFELTDFQHDTIDEEVLVATDDNRILGFISIYKPDNFIHLLFVDPQCTNRGIGKHLLTAALARTGRPAHLKCLSANHHAREFYRRNGWVAESESTTPPAYWNLVYGV